jgi:hypothetical protein
LSPAPAAANQFRLADHAIVVCDGGILWGVDYDVAAKSFGKLAWR